MKKHLINAGIFLFSSILMLIFAEILLRVLAAPAPENPLKNMQRESTFPGLIWELTPGFTSDLYSITKVGFRRPVFSDGDTTAIRIACIGDSHCFGLGVHADSLIYPALLEKQLSRSYNIDVMNFGVPGYNTWQEFAQLREVVLPRDPDIVILGFVYNDADGLTIMHTRDGDQSAGASARQPQTRGITSILKQSKLVLAIKAAVEHVLIDFFDYHPNYMDQKIKLPRWREMKSQLIAMRNLLREKEIPFLVVVFPVTYQLTSPETESAAQQDFMQFLENEQITPINLFPVYREFLQNNGFVFNELIVNGIRDTHPTAAGHAFVAREIIKTLESKNWLKGSTLKEDQ